MDQRPIKTSQQQREARQAAQLRANLKKRKVQARARASLETGAGPQTEQDLANAGLADAGDKIERDEA